VPNKRLNDHRPGKWSINQILNHIISAERLSVSYLQKKFLGIEQAGDSGLVEELKMAFLIASQRLPGLKFKAPKVVVETTASTENITIIAKEWEAVRADLKSFLEKIPEGKERRLIYKHVRAGRLNTLHALKFFREHVVHHIPQIKKLL
jgi:uncharacterized damage-inducible protein DinB